MNIQDALQHATDTPLLQAEQQAIEQGEGAERLLVIREHLMQWYRNHNMYERALEYHAKAAETAEEAGAEDRREEFEELKGDLEIERKRSIASGIECEVEMPDPWLKYALYEDLQESLTRDQLRKVTRLDWDEYIAEADPTWRPISDLTGLEYCVNLKFAGLDGNSIDDVTPLQGLTQLQELWLVANCIRDITPLAGLTNLKTLVLDMNYSLDDIRCLADHPTLEYLNIASTKVADISMLETLPALKKVTLYRVPADISPGTANRRALESLLRRDVDIKLRGIDDIKRGLAS